MTTTDVRTDPDSQKTDGGSGTPFPVVGIGASAGGLEAFSLLLESLPAETGLAFILVQHLDPHHTSQLGELLARITKMPVHEATHGVTVERNHAYVIPPNSYLAIEGGKLQVSPRGGARPHLAVDHFFRSLAKEQGPRAIGVVLSGTGSDGALGLAEIKAAGGITFAQEETSARHAGMPRSAIDGGGVDFVLPPDQIARRLAEIGGHPYLAGPDAPDVEPEDDREEFRRILRSIRGATSVDFEHYRDTTIKRRVARRMALHGITHLKRYADLLTNDRHEVENLYRDVLINVTSFFRDAELFLLLKEKVFPEILRSKPAQHTVRIWVPGCSTGQEAYSIAIALLEFFDEQHHQRPVQIFATDLSEPTSLDKARAGVYPESIEAEVSPERLRRFFRKEDHHYRIEKSIRDLCIFARQNIVSDPPFSHMDLISCRNVLIYMSTVLQKQVLPTFHYALQNNGYLVLGTSETAGQNADLFELVDRSHRIYVKRATMSRPPLYFSAPRHLAADVVRVQSSLPVAPTAASYQKEADRLAAGRYVPASVLVNQDFDIVQFRGETGAFLQPPTGEPTQALLKMAREGLFLELRNGLHDARRTNQPVVRERVRLVESRTAREVTLRILPVRPLGADEPYYLVLFEEPAVVSAPATEVQAASDRPSAGAEPRSGRIARLLRRRDDAERPEAAGPSVSATREQQELLQLRHEFAATKEYMQSLSEQQDAANEEMRSANEEILSSNEELQSTNEELETAKEELQSANEELTTVNEQLQHRNVELNVVGNDLSNLLSSTGIPVVMVGSDLRIRRLTPAARKVLNMLPTDVGRPIGEIRPSLRLTALDPLISAVIEDMKTFEQEVQDSEGAWWLLRIFPYRTQDNRIEGAVVVLIDVDALKRAQGGLREALDYSAAIVQTTHEPLLVLDHQLNVVSANGAFRDKFDLQSSGIEGRSIFEMDGRQWNIPALRDLLQRVTADRRNVDDFSFDHSFEGMGRRSLLVNARWIEQGDSPTLLLLAIEDVTERKQRVDSLSAAVKARDDFLAMLSHELRNPLSAVDTATRVLRRSIVESPGAQQSLEALDRQLGTLRRLVDDLLDVSRLAHGKINLRTEAVDLARGAELAVEAVRPLAEARGHSLAATLPREPIWVAADPVRLDQILHNLLSNAVKFTEPGGEILVSADAAHGNGAEQAVLRVHDNGPGIPPDVLHRVFEDFIQGDNAGGDGRVGLGLGLALVRRLVELHGGSVQAKSGGPRKGTELVVRLPLAKAPRARPAIGDSAAEQTPRASVKRRILIVEDNVDAAQTMETLLGMMGHQVRIVHDGPAALAALAESAPDVAIVDVGLPGMSGYDVAREIRKLPDLDDVVLIAHTGYAQEADREQARAAGFDHHMVKPLDWQALERVLDGQAQKSKEN